MKLACVVFFAPLALCGQTAVTLGGTTYALRDHPRVLLDGPGGALTTALSDTRATGRANANNPIYALLKTNVDNFAAAGYQFANSDYVSLESMLHLYNAAVRWQADGDPKSLALAKYLINHIEDLLGGSIGCDTTKSYCGGRSFTVDLARSAMGKVAFAYSIIRSQLTPEERAAFASKMLADNDLAHNGIDTVACTNQGIFGGAGTLSTSGSSTAVTITGGDTSQLAIGSAILGSGEPIGRVATIVDSTHFTTSIAVNWSGIPFRYSPPWQQGNCGVVWYVKHHQSTPSLAPGQESHYTADYPLTGGSDLEPYHNLKLTAEYGFISIALALADDDARAVTLLQQAYNWYITNYYYHAKSSWTGVTSLGAAYVGDRGFKYAGGIALMLRNSLIHGPDLTTGVYLKRGLPLFYMLAMPDNPTTGDRFQDIYDSHWDTLGMQGPWTLMQLYPADPYTARMNWYMRNRGDWPSYLATNGGSYLSLEYILLDPAWPASNLSEAPTQYLWRDTDCSEIGANCTPNLAYSQAVSRSGWNATDTEVLMQSAYNRCNNDHQGCGDYGAVHIYKRGYLLAGDAKAGNQNRALDNTISIGSDSNWASTAYASIPRWAGDNPTGKPLSQYSYALLDFTGAYASSAQVIRANRQTVHFKSGGQDYVAWYDDLAAATAGTIKAYLHFYHTDCFQAASCASGTSGIAWGGGSDGGTVVNAQANSRLLTTVLTIRGKNTALLGRDNADGTYTGGHGYTYRAYVCAEDPSSPGSCESSATAGEWLVVFKPSLTPSDTMPPLNQPSCSATGGNCTALEIQDPSSPKVAAFARQGTLVKTMAFSTTHSGTAQYVVSGLAPGNYAVKVNDSPVATIAVKDGDTTLSFSSPSGTVSIAAASSSGPEPSGSIVGTVHADGQVRIR